MDGEIQFQCPDSQILGTETVNRTVIDISPNLSTNSSSIVSSTLYEVPTHLVVLLSLLYGMISVVAFFGNTIVIWIICSCRRMHSVTNFYIINLSCADIIISVFSIPFQFQAALLQRWELPAFMCPLCPFTQVLSVNVSIFTLSVIAIDRYCAIMNPLKHRPTKVQVRCAIVVVWVIGGILGLPYLIAFRVVYITKDCLYPVCQNVVFEESTWNLYSEVLVFLQYFIPLVIISYAYARICCMLWGAKTPGNAQGLRDATVLKNKKKVSFKYLWKYVNVN